MGRKRVEPGIYEVTARDGTKTYAVLYRLHGRQTSDTVADLKSARKFRSLIELLAPERALATLEAKEAAGITVDELAQRYFEWKRPDVTSCTLSDYQRDYDNWIRPWFGHRQADTVYELDVQGWVDHMKSQLDAKTVKGHHVLLGGLYRYGCARSRRMVEHNPCTETQLPRAKRKPPRGFTLPEWRALFEATARPGRTPPTSPCSSS